MTEETGVDEDNECAVCYPSGNEEEGEGQREEKERIEQERESTIHKTLREKPRRRKWPSKKIDIFCNKAGIDYVDPKLRETVERVWYQALKEVSLLSSALVKERSNKINSAISVEDATDAFLEYVQSGPAYRNYIKDRQINE